MNKKYPLYIMHTIYTLYKNTLYIHIIYTLYIHFFFCARAGGLPRVTPPPACVLPSLGRALQELVHWEAVDCMLVWYDVGWVGLE